GTKVEGVVSMNPTTGLQGRWVKVGIRKIETIIGGSYTVNVGSSVPLWTADLSWEEVPSMESRLSLELPDDIAPSMQHQRGEIRYEIVATLGTIPNSWIQNNSPNQVGIRHVNISLEEHYSDRRIRQHLSLPLLSPSDQTIQCTAKGVPFLLDSKIETDDVTSGEVSSLAVPFDYLDDLMLATGVEISFSLKAQAVMTSGLTLSTSIPIVISAMTRNESYNFLKESENRPDEGEKSLQVPRQLSIEWSLDFVPKGVQDAPAMEPVLDLLKATARAAPYAIRNKHLIYRILLRCGDICGQIHGLIKYTESGQADVDWLSSFEEYTDLIERLEGILLQLADHISKDCREFSYASMGQSWNEQRENFLQALQLLESRPFPPCQVLSRSDAYFDECDWISLLLHEFILQRVPVHVEVLTRGASDVAPEVLAIVPILLKLEDQIISGSKINPRGFVVNLLTTLAWMMSKPSCPSQLWSKVVSVTSSLRIKDRAVGSESYSRDVMHAWDKLALAAAMTANPPDHQSTEGSGLPGTLKRVRSAEAQQTGQIAEGRWTRPDGTVAPVAFKNLGLMNNTAIIQLKQIIDQVMAKWMKGDIHTLPVYEVRQVDQQGIAIISQWCKNGNILDYLSRQPAQYFAEHADTQLKEVGRAILHLHTTHSPPIAHGDIKAENVLIDDYGEALLSDYGIRPLLAENDPEYISSFPPGVIVNMNEYDAWLKVDRASFATLVLQVLSGKDMTWISTTIQTVQTRGIFPNDCPNLHPRDPLWRALQDSWRSDPKPHGTLMYELDQALYRESRKPAISAA
ncbi:hypothetical protein FRB90_003141, partial [Tulasnella sp. 427]